MEVIGPIVDKKESLPPSAEREPPVNLLINRPPINIKRIFNGDIKL
jgi:hypothetical protein